MWPAAGGPNWKKVRGLALSSQRHFALQRMPKMFSSPESGYPQSTYGQAADK